MEQLCRTLDGLGLRQGYLVLFDRGPRPWEEKRYESTVPGPGGQQVHILGA